MTDSFYAGVDYRPAPLSPPTNSDRVRQFMTAFEQEVHFKPTIPSDQIQTLRYELIREELAELQEAQLFGDLVGIADALADLLYVVYGAGHAYGIDLDACFKEVHRSNMTKLTEDGKVLRREDGKVMKSGRYEAPDLEKIVGLKRKEYTYE
jgi:predicted HAD superfamily Cof-like phosphohydrolase